MIPSYGLSIKQDWEVAKKVYETTPWKTLLKYYTLLSLYWFVYYLKVIYYLKVMYRNMGKWPQKITVKTPRTLTYKQLSARNWTPIDRIYNKALYTYA